MSEEDRDILSLLMYVEFSALEYESYFDDVEIHLKRISQIEVPVGPNHFMFQGIFGGNKCDLQ